jgi:hypothetical protein
MGKKTMGPSSQRQQQYSLFFKKSKFCASKSAEDGAWLESKDNYFPRMSSTTRFAVQSPGRNVNQSTAAFFDRVFAKQKKFIHDIETQLQIRVARVFWSQHTKKLEKYHMTTKCTKCHKMYQMAVRYSKWP